MRLRWWVILSFFLAIFSYAAFFYFITHIWPDFNSIFALPQLILFALLFVSFGATAVPVFTYLNYRFAAPGWLQRDKTRLVRQGSWVGLLGVVLAYLQLIRALNWVSAMVLAAVFILIELFFLTRE